MLMVGVTGEPYLTPGSVSTVSQTEGVTCVMSDTLVSVDISSDPDQVLYGFCTASDDNGKPCGNTVFDFLLNRPLCSKHVTKAVCCSTML